MRFSRVLANLLLFTVAGTAGAQFQAPSNQDFRSPTFTRPSQTMRGFRGSHDGYQQPIPGYPLIFPIIGGDFFGVNQAGPGFFDSTVPGYGVAPFEGMDASRALYSTPFRGPTVPVPAANGPSSFYETTIPYGNYRLRPGRR